MIVCKLYRVTILIVNFDVTFNVFTRIRHSEQTLTYFRIIIFHFCVWNGFQYF